MKYILTTILTLASIIAVQAVLTCAFSFHVGEAFAKTAVSALFFFAIIRLFQAGRHAAG